MTTVAAAPRPIALRSGAAAIIETAVGPLVITARRGRLTGVSAPGTPVTEALRLLAAGASIGEPAGVLWEAGEQLRAYARGALRDFDLPLAFPDSPLRPFWDACLRVPYGRVCSYGELAAAAGKAREARAAGAAMAANPLAVVVPCHRVIDSAGGLHGYGGGLDHKRRLLLLEGALPASVAQFPAWLAARHPGAARPVVAIRSTRIFCLATCRSGSRLNLESRVPDSFASPGAASSGGFRPCRVCRPDLAQGRLLDEPAVP